MPGRHGEIVEIFDKGPASGLTDIAVAMKIPATSAAGGRPTKARRRCGPFADYHEVEQRLAQLSSGAP